SVPGGRRLRSLRRSRGRPTRRFTPFPDISVTVLAMPSRPLGRWPRKTNLRMRLPMRYSLRIRVPGAPHGGSCVKLTRPLALALSFAACMALPQAARAGCPDEPERCVERGANVSRSATVVTGTIRVASAPATQVQAAPARKQLVVAPAHKLAGKPAHAAPSPVTTPPATPGMGMLLKLSGGTGGDVSWAPSRPADNTGASWVL